MERQHDTDEKNMRWGWRAGVWEEEAVYPIKKAFYPNFSFFPAEV